jgi:hypothetical protein
VIVLGLSIGLLFVAGTCVARATGSPDESRATRAVRVMVWAFAVLVVVEATLGACGRLDAGSTLAALTAVALALAVGTRRRAAGGEDGGRAREPLTALDVAYIFALTAAVLLRAWAGAGKATFLYDTLSYHLHVPATWIADRRLQIVPAVFGDPSSAYAPSNLELWFAFLMAPLHSDYLASSGQLPFAALAALAIAAAVREAGGRRSAALAAALVFLLIPEVWQQARTAMTDLGLAALLLASLPFSLRVARQGREGDVLTAATALGLAVGTKYVGLPLALPFALVAVLSARSARRRARPALAATALVLATGGFWYLRNALVTGNPFYPVATLGFPGLTDRAAMRAWIYHLPIGQLGGARGSRARSCWRSRRSSGSGSPIRRAGSCSPRSAWRRWPSGGCGRRRRSTGAWRSCWPGWSNTRRPSDGCSFRSGRSAPPRPSAGATCRFECASCSIRRQRSASSGSPDWRRPRW